jgi:hypothetical protein
MTSTETMHIVALNRTHDGLFISFADGKSAFYSEVMLYSLLDLAEAISKES